MVEREQNRKDKNYIEEERHGRRETLRPPQHRVDPVVVEGNDSYCYPDYTPTDFWLGMAG